MRRPLLSRALPGPRPIAGRTGRLGGALLLAAACLASCSGWGNPERLRVGVSTFTGYAPLARALRGYAPPPGAATVRVHKFSSYFDSLRAFRNGRLDLVAMTQYDALLMHSQGVPLRALALIDRSLGADALVSRPEYPDVRSLAGKRIGLQVDSVNYFLLLQALERHDMDVGEFDLVNLSPHLIEAAFREGGVEAAVLWEPFVSNLRGQSRVLVTSRSLPIPIVDMLWIRADRLERLRPHVRPLLRHYFATLETWLGDPDDLADQLAAEDRVSKREVRLALRGLRIYCWADNLELARLAGGAGTPTPAETGLQDAADFLYRKAILGTPLDTSGLFDGSLTLQALERGAPGASQ